MITRLATVTFVALISLSPPQQSQTEEIAELKRQVQELREQQAQMQRELTAIKNFLQSLLKPQGGAPDMSSIVGASIPTANEPSMGSTSAKITIMEISDYHCPFCKRQTQQTFPQLIKEYVDSGKAQFIFVDYPIAQLHPAAARSHAAANCAGEQGKYWEMHVSLFNSPVAKEDAALVAQAKQIGIGDDRGAIDVQIGHAGARAILAVASRFPSSPVSVIVQHRALGGELTALFVMLLHAS